MAGRNVVKAIVDLDDRLSRKLDRVGRSVRGFKKDSEDGARGTAGWTRKIDEWGGKVNKWFSSKTSSLVRGWFMSLKVSAAIGFAAVTAGVVGAFKKFSELDATLRNTTGLLAGVGATSAQSDRAYQAFSKEVLRLAPEMAKSPQDLANSLYDIVSGGFEGAAATKVLTSATKGASAGMTDSQTVANALVKTLQAYGYEADKASELTDQMFQSVNVGIISFEEMAQQLGDVVGLASTAKVSFADLMASIAIMTKKGMVPAEAFTSLNQFMLAILAPGPAEQEAAAAIFGKDVEKQWSAKAVAAQGLGGVIENLMEKLNPSRDQLSRLNSMNNEVADMAAAEIAGDKIDVLTSLFGNVRALRGALVLASGGAYSFADAQADIGKSAGATDRVLAEQEKTIAKQTDRAKAYWEVIQAQVMSDIAPAVGDKVKDANEWIQGILGSDDYKNAKGTKKLGVIGKAVWGEITDWWKDHKEAVSKKMSEGIEWLGDKAVPVVVEFGVKLGEEMVPAIFKGLMNTTPGKLLVGGVALSWAQKLGTPLGTELAKQTGSGGAGGVGGTGAGAGGAGAGGPLSGLRSITANSLAITGAAIAVYGAITTAKEQGAKVAGAERDARERIKTMSTKELEGQSEKDLNNFATGVWGMWPGNKTPRELVEEELARRKPVETANTIRTYADNGMLDMLAQFWKNPSMFGDGSLAKTDQDKLGKNDLFTKGSRLGNSSKNLGFYDWWEQVTKGSDFQTTIRTYGQDPKKLSEEQRKAVEFLIDNTSASFGRVIKDASNLSKFGLDPTRFSETLGEMNPILNTEGLGPVTEEWVIRMAAARDQMKKVNALLAIDSATWSEKEKKGFWGFGFTTPGNPRDNGATPKTEAEKKAEADRAKWRAAEAENRREELERRNAERGGRGLMGDWLSGRGGPGGFFKGQVTSRSWTAENGNVPTDYRTNNRFYNEGGSLKREVPAWIAEAVGKGKESNKVDPAKIASIFGGELAKRPEKKVTINIDSPLVGKLVMEQVGDSIEDTAANLAEMLLEAIKNGAGDD